MIFKKDYTPWNKGKKMPQTSGKNSPFWKGGLVKKNCLICNKQFFTKPSQIKNGDGKYCSKFCYHKSWIGRKHSQKTIAKMKKRIPSMLGKHLPQWLKDKISESLKKRQLVGSKNSNWKGGKRIDNGYICIYKPDHPFANGNYVYEHRFIMEQHLGRYLKPEERVHHIDSNKINNRIENLILFANDSEHKKFHHPKGFKIGKKFHF